MTFSEDIPMVGDLTNIPLEVRWCGRDSTIGGSYDTSIGDRQIAFVAAQTMDSTVEMMADLPTDPWTVTFSERLRTLFPDDTDFSSATSLPLHMRTKRRRSVRYDKDGQRVSCRLCQHIR